MKTKQQTRQVLGRYIVSDPDICHGKPTFRGTRVLVSDVLEMVAEGMAWETIIVFASTSSIVYVLSGVLGMLTKWR